MPKPKVDSFLTRWFKMLIHWAIQQQAIAPKFDQDKERRIVGIAFLSDNKTSRTVLGCHPVMLSYIKRSGDVVFNPQRDVRLTKVYVQGGEGLFVTSLMIGQENLFTSSAPVPIEALIDLVPLSLQCNQTMRIGLSYHP